MKGILLAGGSGTRLRPATLGVSKQLLAVYDKPMVYYPLSTLISAGIREVLVISAPEDVPGFRRLLGDGSHLGMRIEHAVQPRPEGIAQALLIGADFLGGDHVALVLGDNLFHGPGLGTSLRRLVDVEGAVVLAAAVAEPSAYGVVELDDRGRPVSLEEKPARPRSHLAVPGLYFYDHEAVEIARTLTPSARGELEITDVHRDYLRRGRLAVEVLRRGTAWLDMGTFAALNDASTFVRTLQERQGLLVGSPEEAAWRVGFLDDEGLRARGEALRASGYGEYLLALLRSR